MTAFMPRFNWNRSVAAESATYVEGGDIQYCTPGNQPVTREPNGVPIREYDCCLTTLAVFKMQQEAFAYHTSMVGDKL